MRVPKGMRSAVAMIVLVCFFVVGCIGPFTLSRSLGKWNAGVGNKWEDELVFLGLVIFHVYTITGLIDVLILNPIWFWKAPNTGPISSENGSKEIVMDKEHRAILTFTEKEKTVRADLFEQGRWIDSIRVTEYTNGSLVAENADGRVHFVSRSLQNGIQQVIDPQGEAVFSYSLLRIERRIVQAQRGIKMAGSRTLTQRMGQY